MYPSKRLQTNMLRALILLSSITLLTLNVCLTPLRVFAEESAEAIPMSSVTKEILDSKIAQVGAEVTLPDEIKAKLLELYNKALSNLETADANKESAATFSRLSATAPGRIQSILAELSEAEQEDDTASQQANTAEPLSELESILKQEEAELAALEASKDEIERQLNFQQKRPIIIRQQLVEARQQQQQVTVEIQSSAKGAGNQTMKDAQRWVLETQYAALSNRISMLDQEMLSNPVQMDLLVAKRDQADAAIKKIRYRVSDLSGVINTRRQSEALEARASAELSKRESEKLNPVLHRLSQQNLNLTDDLNSMASELDTLIQEREEVKRFAERVSADFNDTQMTIETGGFAKGLGRVLLEQRKSLPDTLALKLKSRLREKQIAEAGVLWLRFQAEARSIADLEQTVTALEARFKSKPTLQEGEALRTLVEQRQLLLQKALESNRFYLKRLHELDEVERSLLQTAKAYDGFLLENLIWLRSGEPTQLVDIINFPQELGQLAVHTAEFRLIKVIFGNALKGIVFFLVIALFLLSVWKQRTLCSAIQKTAKRIDKPTTDSFAYTLQALTLTLLSAAPVPLVLVVTGLLIRTSGHDPELSNSMGATLINVGIHLFILRSLYFMSMPQGLAEAHFKWPRASLKLLQIQTRQLTWIFIPALLVARLSVDLNPVETGGMTTELCIIISEVALAFFFYRTFHPKRGALAYLRFQPIHGLIFRTSPVWFPLLVLYPLGLIFLWSNGFLFTAVALSNMLEHSLWIFIGLVMLKSLAMRWLRVTRQRLAYDALVERRQAAISASQDDKLKDEEKSDVPHVEEPEIDLAALDDDTRDLINITLIFAGLVGLYMIWSTIFPALGVFDDVNLWYHTVKIDGEDKRVPVTLANLGLALIYAIGIGILAKRLPALLEIILLRRFDLSSGRRYTITTLTNYSIIAIGILLVLNTIGADWSQLQWLVAALGVGIGFGLQEIIANFISGLIILFERPIQVGDTVTVGDTDGTVTKIRIRATTIQNWDGKELLVPNKEFITGRLLNWSLSDPILRILVNIGIAYGSDVQKASKLLKDAAIENENVLSDPSPSVHFMSFGDNSLIFRLACFVDSVDLRLATVSALNRAINDKFNAAGIVIAFPQRDLHLNTDKPLRVTFEDVTPSQ